MSNLRTDYKDDVFTGSRKYHMTNNQDGTVSFTDETEYEQNGDTYGAAQINEVNDIINKLDSSAYRSTDGAENALADNDYLPFYDTSASASKKTPWSNIKSLLTQLLAIKVHNSNSAGTYGAGNASMFGHVKLSDNYTASAGNASQSIGASSQAAYNAYNTANTNSVNRYNEVVGELTANGNRIYMDYKNGKYGFNTSPTRGADSFHPFNSSSYTLLTDVIENNLTYTFTYPYSCAVVMIGGKWVDIATCVGNNCDVVGGWYHSWGSETAGGRLWFVNNISVGSQITWSVNGENAGGTILGIG